MRVIIDAIGKANRVAEPADVQGNSLSMESFTDRRVMLVPFPNAYSDTTTAAAAFEVEASNAASPPPPVPYIVVTQHRSDTDSMPFIIMISILGVIVVIMCTIFAIMFCRRRLSKEDKERDVFLPSGGRYTSLARYEQQQEPTATPKTSRAYVRAGYQALA